MEITLKAARVNAGLTQKQAAEALQISKGALLNYEQYRTVPDVAMAWKMAELYNLPVSSIIFFRKIAL